MTNTFIGMLENDVKVAREWIKYKKKKRNMETLLKLIEKEIKNVIYAMYYSDIYVNQKHYL